MVVVFYYIFAKLITASFLVQLTGFREQNLSNYKAPKIMISTITAFFFWIFLSFLFLIYLLI